MTDPALWLLGLALSAACLVGWAAARRRSADVTRAYLKGFRYILSGEPDAALEELTRAAEVDAGAVETYFALGALFRRTGDHERAIRLHQNMLLRSDLAPELRCQIELELALDFQHAAMPGRAMETYHQLLAKRPDDRDALERLRQVCEQQRDWARAAEVQGRLLRAGEGGPEGTRVLCHLLAEAALVETDAETAVGFARRACELGPDHSHALLALGTVLVRLPSGASATDEERASAVALLERACHGDPELAVFAAPPLAEAQGAAQAASFLVRLLGQADHPAPRLAEARLLRAAGQAEAAAASLRRALELDPHYVEARVELGRALLESSLGADARRELEAQLAALGQQEPPGFRCRSCGCGYGELQFRCARCQGWDTVRRAAGAPAAAAAREPDEVR